MDTQEEYRLFLQQVNRLTDRRQAVTATYLTVNAAIVAAIAFVFKDAPMLESGRQGSGLVLLVAGIVSCDLWRRLIGQYSTLLGWWYKQLRDLEAQASPSNRLLTKEYDALYAEAAGKNKVGLTKHEIGLTYLFMTVYLVFGVSLLFPFIRSVL